MRSLFALLVMIPFPALAQPKDNRVNFLFTATKRGNKGAVARLLRDLHTPVYITNYHTDDEDQTGFNETILLCSIKEPEHFIPAIFNLILARGADINQTAHNGLSPLHKALLFENEAAARVLILRGAHTQNRISITNDICLDAQELADRMGLKNIHEYIKHMQTK